MKLALERVSVIERGRALLRDVSLELGAGDFVVLVGPNGAGKSTLMRAALGVLPSASGRVTLGDTPVRSLSGRDRAARVSWMPQRTAFHDPQEVLDFVAGARFRFNETVTTARQAAAKSLGRVDAAVFAERDLSTLSGGEQQRVALAALLAQEAPLLMLDEPAAHLDPRQQLEVHGLLVSLWQEGKGTLCATHDLNLLAHAVTLDEAARVRVVGLRDGQVRFECRYDSHELTDHLGELFDVRMDSIVDQGRRFFISRARQTGAA